MEETPVLFPADSPPPRRRKVDQPKLYVPTSADIEKLKAFPDCFFFSIDQLIRYVGLSPNSLTAIQELFAILSGNKKNKPSLPYLLRMTPDYNKRGGSAPYIYFLGSDGIKLLRDRGYDPDILALYYKRVRKLVEKSTLPADIDHYLAVTEFIIAVRQLPKLEPRISLHSTIHDWQLRKSEYPSTVFEGQSSDPIAYPFHPDNLTEFYLIRAEHEQRVSKRIFLEMDMGTHTSRSRFKKKLAAYIDFFSSGTYANLLGNVRNYMVLYATPKGEGRREELRLWTRGDVVQQ